MDLCVLRLEHVDMDYGALMILVKMLAIVCVQLIGSGILLRATVVSLFI
jgi:hypothetical protein